MTLRCFHCKLWLYGRGYLEWQGVRACEAWECIWALARLNTDMED